MSDRCYVAISPCRDEGEHAARSIESVLAQTVRPARWIIVDDGSTDETPRIIERFASRHSWITVLRLEDRGRRAVGPGVIDAFYAGLQQVPDLHDFDYLCKLDLDVELPPRYFEMLIERMEADPRLGTCSGKAYFERQSRTTRDSALGPQHFISECIGDEMSAGMTKFYRISCFKQIAGFVREVMWDGIDCHRCRMLGWKARSWDEPDLRFIHLRPMGSSQKTIWSGRARHGYGQWFMGTSLAYMTASAIFRMTRPPLIVGGMAMWLGYVASMIRGLPRYPDIEFRRFLRSYQWHALLRGKARATARLENRTASRWRLPGGTERPLRLGEPADGFTPARGAF